MEYRWLAQRGALGDASGGAGGMSPLQQIPDYIIELIPASVARENQVVPLSLEDETLEVATINAKNLLIKDKLTFILNKRIEFVEFPANQIQQAIKRYYPETDVESVDSMLAEFTDTAIDIDESVEGTKYSRKPIPISPPSLARSRGKTITEFRKGRSSDASDYVVGKRRIQLPGEDATEPIGGSGMFFYTVEEGQRVLMRRKDGTMDIVIGPKRIWIGRKTFQSMKHFLAHPGEFLILRYRDGRQEHLPGPSELWFDPRIHQEITRQDALQLAAKEAVVVYYRSIESDRITRRIVQGPAQFVPQPGEWLHTFSWHASKGGHLGVEKVPNGLVFQKLWMMPDQMYHDVQEVRTADDALLTVKLMLFFELIDIEKMLDTTHDPIGDFVNAATSDVIAFTGRHDFESFKRNVTELNELESYRQLASRAQQCGYRINKVVYRGYSAPQSLQKMHDEAIEARTRLQLDRATEEQAQDLENYKLDCQINRATKRRGEQSAELDHDLDIARRRQEAELKQKEAQLIQAREQKRLEGELHLQLRQNSDAEQRSHLAALKEMGVDLTAYLTQSRADRVIELRGGNKGTHVHIDATTNGQIGEGK